MASEPVRTETKDGVRNIVLCRADEYNTSTPGLRDALAAAIDDADEDREVRVILLRAEGPAFCAGYGLDWSTDAQAAERAGSDANPPSGAAPWRPDSDAARARSSKQWDSVADHRMMSRFVETYMKLWSAHSTMSVPPPMHQPWTAAIVGFRAYQSFM